MKLVLYSPEDILGNEKTIVRNNAFIRKDGSFYLAKGYTGANPSHQLDSSALAIGREDIGFDFVEKYMKKYPGTHSRPNYYNSDEIIELAKLLNDKNADMVENSLSLATLRIKQERLNLLKRKRTILIQFYGYALFAREENLFSKLGREQEFYDHSVLPNPEWYGQKPTEEQMETMKLLLELNKEDGKYTPQAYLKKMKFHYGDSIWHC